MQNIINRNRLIAENNDMSVLIISLIVYLCFCNFPINTRVTNLIKYIVDLIVLVLLFAMFYNQSIRKKFLIPLFFVQIGMLTIGTVIALINLLKPLQIFWCLRSFLKPLIFFIACIEFLDIGDIKKIMKFFKIFYYINFILILFEFFVLGARDDCLGGISGISPGSTTVSNLLLTFMVTYFFVLFAFKKQNIIETVFVLISSILMATLMELKYFYFELLLIICVITFLYCAYSGNAGALLVSIIGIFCVLITLYYAILLLIQIYPKWNNLLHLSNWILEITRESGYNGNGEINRLFFVDTINNLFHGNNLVNMIFGEGISASQVSYNNVFASKDTALIRIMMINDFSMPMIYLDCGYIGMLLYILSFIVAGIQGVKYLLSFKNLNIQCTKNNKNTYLEIVDYSAMIVIFSITIIALSIPMLIYNSSMIYPEACIYYFGIACMYIVIKKVEVGIL